MNRGSQDVSDAYTSLFSDTDDLKMALRARKPATKLIRDITKPSHTSSQPCSQGPLSTSRKYPVVD